MGMGEIETAKGRGKRTDDVGNARHRSTVRHTRSLKPLLCHSSNQHRRDRRVVCHGKLQSDAGFGTGGYDVDSDASIEQRRLLGTALGIRVCTLLAPGAAADTESQTEGEVDGERGSLKFEKLLVQVAFSRRAIPSRTVCTSGSFRLG